MRILLEKLVRLGNYIKPYKTKLLATSLAFSISFLISFVGNTARGLDPLADPSILITALASLLTFFLWLLATDVCFSFIGKKYVSHRNKDPKIGVLWIEGLTEDEVRRTSRATEFTPNDWAHTLKTKGLHVEFIDPSRINDEYSMIINPFGELYPEEDTSNMSTLKRIMEYIKTGGVFVNAAGLPFFYMKDFKNNIEGLTGPMLKYYVGGFTSTPFNGLLGRYQPSVTLEPAITDAGSSLVDTWLYQNLGIRTTVTSPRLVSVRTVKDPYFEGLVNNDGIEVLDFRSAIRCEVAHAKLIPILISILTHEITGQVRVSYPIAAVNYGLGYLVLIGMALKKDRINNFKLAIECLKRIINKLQNRGTLD